MADYKSMIKGTLNSLTEKAKDLAESGAVKDFYDKGTNKAKSVSRIAKLSLELNGESEDLKKVYAEIGELYYEQNVSNPQGFFVPLFDKVEELTTNIEVLQKELEAMKAELQTSDDISADDFDAIVSQTEDANK